MGNVMKSIMHQANQTDAELQKELQEHLKNLEELGRNKLDGFKKGFALEIDEDRALPVAGKVNEHEELQAFYSKSNDAFDKIVDNVGELVSTIVNISQDSSKSKEQSAADTTVITNRATSMVKSVTNAILGIGKGASYERKDFSVFFVNNSLIKLNWAVYFYSLFSSKLDGTSKIMVSVLYFRVDVLDMIASKTDVLIYEATNHLGIESARQGIKDAIDTLVDIEEKNKN